MLKRLRNHPITTHVLALLIALYGRLVFLTSRTIIHTTIPPELKQGPVMLALWHQHIFAVPLFAKLNPAPLMGLMSASRDGQLTRQIARYYGITAAIGSSHKGGMTAARTLIHATRGKHAHSLFLTPDGPRGPAQVAKPGATEIARLTRLPVIPAAAYATRGHTFKSWDSFRLPYPFTTFHVVFGSALSPQATPEALTQSLNTLTTQAQAFGAGLQGNLTHLG